MANLEALTSKLKMSFDNGEEAPAKSENVQSKEEINLDNKKVPVAKAAVKP